MTQEEWEELERELQELELELPPATKECAKCDREKDIDLFEVDVNGNVTDWCKACVADFVRRTHRGYGKYKE